MNAPALFTITVTPEGITMDATPPAVRGVINGCRNAARVFRNRPTTARERAGYLQGIMNAMGRAGTVAELHGQVLALRPLEDAERVADALDHIAATVRRQAAAA